MTFDVPVPELIVLAEELAKDIVQLVTANDPEQERERLILMQRRIQEEIARRELPP